MPRDSASLSKQVSRRLVAEALLNGAPISRADLSRVTGLSKQTMSSVVAELEAEGWVRSVGVVKGGVGRTAITYDVAKDAAYSVGVDLGGSKVTAAIADLVGTVLGEATEPTDPRAGLDALNQLQALVARLARRHGVSLERVHSVVVGMPGVVDPASGVVALVPNIPGLGAISVTGALADLFGQEVVVENDVNLAMLGEAWKGCARGCQNAGFLALGTGAGLGLIVNGKLVRGASGAAGEIAYLPIGRDLESPDARSVGAFELEVGALGILRRYQARGGEAAQSVRDVFARLAAGDAAAAGALDETARSIALAITALQAIVDPQIVAMGGSIGVRPELIERVRAAMAAYSARRIDIRASDLGPRAGLVGAVSLAVNRLHNREFGVFGLPSELTVPVDSLARAAE